MSRSTVLRLPLWLTAGACWSLPFLVAPHTYPIPTFYAELGAAACWIAFSLVVLALTWGSKTGLPKIALAPLALIGVLLLQLRVATPLNPFFSLAAIVVLLGAAAICAVGARCRDIPGGIEAVVGGLILGGLLTVAVELVHLLRVDGLPTAFFSMTPTGVSRRMWGNLNQPNHVASYLAMGLAGCLLFAYRYPRRRFILAIATVSLLVGMALTFSRTAWLHLVVIGVLAGMIVKADEAPGTRGWLRAILPLVALLITYQICSLLIDYANGLWNFGLPTSMGARMENGVSDRMPIWTHAWHMFLAHPWLGGGWGDYAWNQYVQTDVLGHVAMSMNAHNAVLDLLAKVGAVGLLAVLLPFLGLAYTFLRQKMTPTRAFFCAIFLILLVHSMLEYPLHYLYFLLPFAFALGFVDERNSRMPSGSMSWVLIGVVSLCSAGIVGRIWFDYSSVERLYATENFQKDVKRYQADGQVLLTPYATLALAMNAGITYEMAPVMAAIERQAVQLYPGPATVQRYALALALQGKTDEAIVQVRRLKNQYWTEYAEQSTVLAFACAKKSDYLDVFCARLKSENLLVEKK